MKYLHIVGNRPQFIKLMPFIKATKDRSHIENVVVHSGQHYDYEMSKIFFDQLELPKIDHNLEVGSASGNVQTGKILQRIDPIIEKERPDIIIVYGDTNTTLGGALAGYKAHVPVAHVEAGMREFIWRPEEINKKMADHCSNFCFCPMERAALNLKNEGIDEKKIFLTGDITYDTFLLHRDQALKFKPAQDAEILNQDYILMTMHRAETVNDPQRVIPILEALERLKLPLVFPVHPHTRHSLDKLGLLKRLEQIKHLRMITPVGYLEFLAYILHSRAVITDSSGVIKETFYARKPGITIDETTEYREIFDMGWNRLTGFKSDAIVNAVNEALSKAVQDTKQAQDPFGRGDSAKRMVEIIETRLH